MVLATVTFPTSAPTLLALAIDRMTSGKVVPMQVTGMASAPNAARARTDSRPGQPTTRSPRLAKRSGILSQMGSDAASAMAATARLNASAPFLAKRAIRLASGVPGGEAHQEDREHEAESVDARTNDEREHVHEDDLRGEDQEARRRSPQ